MWWVSEPGLWAKPRGTEVWGMQMSSVLSKASSVGLRSSHRSILWQNPALCLRSHQSGRIGARDKSAGFRRAAKAQTALTCFTDSSQTALAVSPQDISPADRNIPLCLMGSWKQTLNSPALRTEDPVSMLGVFPP